MESRKKESLTMYAMTKFVAFQFPERNTEKPLNY